MMDSIKFEAESINKQGDNNGKRVQTRRRGSRGAWWI